MAGWLKARGLIVPTVTPYDSRGNVDFDAIRAHVDFLIEKGVNGLYPGGTTGEGPLLSDAERRQTAEVIIDQARGRVPVIVQIGALTTDATIALASHARDAGADAVAAVTPWYYVLSDAALIEYYRSKRSVLCEDCKRRLTKNPLRVLDCKVETCQELKGKAPHIVDSLCEACQAHFMSVVDFLDELDIPYQHNPHLVRGIDYYTRTVFEFYAIREELPDQEEEEKRTAPIALGGGGRYDNLIEMFGGQSTPAAGFGIGLERVVLALKAVEAATQTRLIPPKKPTDIFVAQLGEQAKRKAMVLFEDLIAEGFSVAESFTKDSLKAQLELANKMDVKLSLILGQQELIDGTIIIRNMEGGEQEVVDRKKLIKILHKKLTVENIDAV